MHLRRDLLELFVVYGARVKSTGFIPKLIAKEVGLACSMWYNVNDTPHLFPDRANR